MKAIGIVRERKEPADKRTPLSPWQCVELKNKFPGVELYVEPSPDRCFTDKEYEKEGVELREDLSDCDILLGIKEIPVEYLIPGKKYLFFSHTIKKQPHNRGLLREVLAKSIELVDYECLTWENGTRILGFGRFAGIVGAYNGFLTWGRKFGTFDLKPVHQCKNYLEVKTQLKKIQIPAMKIALTGDGRVAHGALEILRFLDIKEVAPGEFLEEHPKVPVFVHLRSDDYYEHKDGKVWDKADFYHNPEDYISTFRPFSENCDLMMNAIFWNERIPRFFTREQMKSPGFRIKVIADISCDINGSIPATVKATTIADPVFGWHALSESVTEPFLRHTVDIMAVSNLPCELPVDASVEFGNSLLRSVFPHLLSDGEDPVIQRATIARDGRLTQKFSYLEDYVS